MKLKLISWTRNQNEDLLKLFGVIPIWSKMRRDKEFIGDTKIYHKGSSADPSSNNINALNDELTIFSASELKRFDIKLDSIFIRNSMSFVTGKYILKLEGKGKDKCGNLIDIDTVCMEYNSYFKGNLASTTRGGAGYPIEVFKEMWKLGDVDKSSIDFNDKNTTITLKYLGLGD